MHNLELRDELDALKDAILSFVDLAEDAIEEFDDEIETEYEFLEDESGVSNTELDILLDTLNRTVKLIEQVQG